MSERDRIVEQACLRRIHPTKAGVIYRPPSLEAARRAVELTARRCAQLARGRKGWANATPEQVAESIEQAILAAFGLEEDR